MTKRILLGLGGTPYTDVAIDLFLVTLCSMHPAIRLTAISGTIGYRSPSDH
jgi:hypothetical protein